MEFTEEYVGGGGVGGGGEEGYEPARAADQKAMSQLDLVALDANMPEGRSLNLENKESGPEGMAKEMSNF